MSQPNRFSEPRLARRRLGVSLAAVLLVAALVPAVSLAQAPPAQPQSGQSKWRLLDAPRAAGQVGERYDGFAVTRANAPPDVAALVDKVNQDRREVYATRAEARGVPASEIAMVYALEIFRHAPAGTWFLGENGQWTRK